MSSDPIGRVIAKAVHEAIGRMSMAEVRDLMVSPYAEIREGAR